MKITAQVRNGRGEHHVVVSTGDVEKRLVIPRIEYSAKVSSAAPEAELLDLMAWTDRVTEIQNTVRRGVAVTLARAEAVPAGRCGRT